MKSCEKYVAPESDYYVHTPGKSAREMFFYPLQCGHFIYEAGYSLRRESYDSFLLMYIQKGSLVLDLENQTVPVSAGCFVLLDCYRSHAYASESGWECLWCHFDGIVARQWYTAVTARLGNAFVLPDPSALGRLTAIYDTFAAGSPVHEPLMSKYLSDILTAFLLSAPLENGSRSHTNMAEEIMTYINEHFTENITVEELAAKAGLSPCHFIRIFRKEAGFTPHEYLIHTRLSTARYLLKNSDRAVKDICFRSGFSSESVFCSSFKKHFGMTPAQYRASGAAGLFSIPPSPAEYS